MRISIIIIGLLFFSAVIMGMGQFYTDFGDTYLVEHNDTYLSVYNTSAGYVHGFANQSYNEFNNSEGGFSKFSVDNFGQLIVTSFFTLAKSFTGSVTALTGAIVSVGQYEQVQIPSWAIALLMSGILLIISFAIMNAVWKKEW
jgi:hypothetical protein